MHSLRYYVSLTKRSQVAKNVSGQRSGKLFVQVTSLPLYRDNHECNDNPTYRTIPPAERVGENWILRSIFTSCLKEMVKHECRPLQCPTSAGVVPIIERDTCTLKSFDLGMGYTFFEVRQVFRNPKGNMHVSSIHKMHHAPRSICLCSRPAYVCADMYCSGLSRQNAVRTR